ncbi:MAG: antitoxin [Limisphaerales bacterium]
MIKTQVQIPEGLYREAKRVAEEYEMSFAEVVRRSLERTLPAYPPKLADWQPPEPLSLGMRGPIEDDEWRLLANEPDYLPRGRRRSRK